jgi:hypothetical protein
MSKGDNQRIQWSKDYQKKFDRIFKKKERCDHPYRKQGCCDICGEDLIGE